MATGKQGFVRAAESEHSVSMQKEKEMRVQAPLTAMYIQAMPGLPTYTATQPTALQDAAVIPLPVPMMCSNQPLPILTLHIASGAPVQQQRPETPASSPRPKSTGKHVCPHCGRDCMKPSVLEKHLRCHTGERPYPCTTCGISFKTQSNLYKHKRTQAHARLSNESGKGDFSSQESTESSRETCTSPSLELQREDDLGGINKSGNVQPAKAVMKFSSTETSSTECKIVSDTELALRNAAVVGLIASPAHGQQEILNTACQRAHLVSEAKTDATSLQIKSPAGDGRPPMTPNRTPLQRQEALFPKLCRGKSQSHDSTDSGFSESSEPHLTSSPGDITHDPSMESLPESRMELQEHGSSEKPSDVATDDGNSKVSVQEKQKLEEHILKLISENSMLVDDKHLVTVRPRKTVLSKQGSIDLPMPYTYKDSFHFEMRSSKHQVSNSQTQDRRGRAMYSSVPTQHSTSLEHAPLTRSSSLPFSVGIQNSDRTTSSYQGDSFLLSRRCSAGNILPFKSVDQHAQSHRSLVRQVAVDCLSGAEGYSVDRGSHYNLSSDGDCGDASTESGVKRCRKKKAQKFAYNKWYMYGGGTFKKLYSTEKDNLFKSRKATLGLEQTENQGIQISQQRDSNSSVSVTSCPAVSPPAVNSITAQTTSPVISSYVLLQSPLSQQTTGLLQQSSAKQTNVLRPNLNNETVFMQGAEEKCKGPDTHLSNTLPSERKKQKTDDNISVVMKNVDTLMRQQCVSSRQVHTKLQNVISQPLKTVCSNAFHTPGIAEVEKGNRLNLHEQVSLSSPSTSNQTQLLFKRHSSPLFVASVSETSGSPSATSNISSVSQAKNTFLPKYQLKIPCSTDVSDPCVYNHSSLNLTSPSENPKLSHQSGQQCDPVTNLASVQLSHSSTTMATSGQELQGTLCTPAIPKTKSTAIKPVACSGEDANKAQTLCQPCANTSATMISATPTVVSLIPENKHVNMPNMLIQNQSIAYTLQSKSGVSSPILSQPLQTLTAMGQNQSVTISTMCNMDSSMSHSSPSTKPLEIHATTAESIVQNNPATSVIISRQPSGPALGTYTSVCQSSTDGIPLETSHTAFQGPQFEGKMLLMNDSTTLAQDTFYVRTADLQIVMQLISDEQLALIEPQIEKQDFVDGSHSFLNKDPETSSTDTLSRDSQRTYKPCLDETEKTQSPGNAIQNMLSKIPEITPISVGPVDTNVENRSKNACDLHSQNIYSTDSCPKGGISSQSKTEHRVSAPLDTSANKVGQQYKSLSYEGQNFPKDLKSAGGSITIRSYLDQRHDKRLSTETVSGQLSSKTSVHDRVSRNLSAPVFKGMEQSCETKWSKDTTTNLGAADTSMSSLNKPETSTESWPVLSKESNVIVPEVPHTKIKKSDNQPVLMAAGQNTSLHLISDVSQSADGSMVQTKTKSSCVSEALQLSLDPMSTTASMQVELLSTVQPVQPQASLLSCASPASVRQTNSGTGYMVSNYNPLNQRSMYTTSKLNQEAQIKKSGSPGQAHVQHLSQQYCSTLEKDNNVDVEALTASPAQMTRLNFESDESVSESTQMKSTECGEAPGDTISTSQESTTGPRVGGSLQTSQLQREAGTGSQGWVPQEPESEGEGGKRVSNDGMEQEDHAREVKKEDAKASPEEFKTALKPHPHLSQSVTNAIPLLTHLATSSLSDSDTSPLTGTISLSHNPSPVGQWECSPKGTPKLAGQSKEKKMERVLSGCQKSFPSLSTGPDDLRDLHPTCGHLLAHPLLVNAMQKEVQKERQTKKSGAQMSNSKRSQTQRPPSEPKENATAKYSVSNEPCVTISLHNTDTTQTINTTPTQSNPPCSNQSNNNAMHSHTNATPIGGFTTHHNTIDPGASQCNLGGSYLEEEISSSSDDEGKLVIELE